MLEIQGAIWEVADKKEIASKLSLNHLFIVLGEVEMMP